MTIHIHQDINAVVRDLCSCFVIRHFPDVGPMFHGSLDSPGQRAVGFRSAIIREHFNVFSDAQRLADTDFFSKKRSTDCAIALATRVRHSSDVSSFSS